MANIVFNHKRWPKIWKHMDTYGVSSSDFEGFIQFNQKSDTRRVHDFGHAAFVYVCLWVDTFYTAKIKGGASDSLTGLGVDFWNG